MKTKNYVMVPFDSISLRTEFKDKKAKMALDRSPDFLRLLKPFFFFCPFQRRMYKNFLMSVQCKKPPFTNTMFIDRSKFQEQF